MKIGRYTEDEILEHLTEGEGRGFLGRSMYDAIFDKIHALITENEQLKNDKTKLQNNWNTLKQKLEKTIKSIEKESLINFKKEKKCYQTVLNEMLEMEKENE